MSARSFDAEHDGSRRDETSRPECLEARHGIMTAVFTEEGVVARSVSAHLEGCAACRDWEMEFRKMHGLCRMCGEPIPSRSACDILETCTAAPTRRDAGLIARARAWSQSGDGGALLVVLLAIVLFQVALAALLEGSARMLYPILCSIAMLGSTLWVFFDSARRGMPASFWTALQPFTVPIGLIVYLVCRERGSTRCSACGALLPGVDSFCPRCGAKLVEFCCGCGRPVRKEFRVCPHCGTSLAECFPLEGAAGRACGWSRAQKAFLVGGNFVLAAGLVATLAWGDASTRLVGAFLFLFGLFPIFNWVSVDSRRRAMNTIAWGALGMLTSYIGLVAYLACRRDVRVECPVCGSFPPASFNFCPCCGSSLGASCPICGASAALGGQFCVSCGEKLS